MSVLDTFDRYYVAFRLDGVKATTDWTRSIDTLNESIEMLESYDADIRYIKAKESNSFGKSDRFDLEELRKPAIGGE